MKIKCKKHPSYKAIRKPRSGCEKCLEIFEMRQKIMSVIPTHRIRDKETKKLVETDMFQQFCVDMEEGRDLDTWNLEYEFSNGAVLSQTRNAWLGE